MEYAKNQFNLTDGAMMLIDEIVQDDRVTEREKILEAVCKKLEDRYGGDALEAHLAHMNLPTTFDILRAIDIYFIIREEFPDYSFRHGKKKAS